MTNDNTLRLTHITYKGPPFLPTSPVIPLLPENLLTVLKKINGYVQFGGGLHLRGVCGTPEWHCLSTVMIGERALGRLYPALREGDVPFGQDCIADQFILRDGMVYRLHTDNGELESLQMNLQTFFYRVEQDPVGSLGMHPLLQLRSEGKDLEPGQIIHVNPPFCSQAAANGVTLTPAPSMNVLAGLAALSRHLGVRRA